MAYSREHIQSLIAENKRVKDLISVQKPVEKKPATFIDIMESYIDQRIAGLIEEMKPKDGKNGKDAITPVKGKDYFTPQELQKISDYIDSKIPIKGVHYFDGEDGQDAYTPQKGIDYFDGEDGKNIEPEEVRMMIQELLNEIDVKDLGGVTQEDIDSLLDSRQKISQQKIEKRLSAIQPSSKLKKQLDELTDTVMRNYGGHGGSGGGSAVQRDVFIATNNQTVFTASKTVVSDVGVYESGTLMTPTTDYTNTTTTLTLTVGVPAGTVVIWYYNI